MRTYNITCPACGHINRNLYLAETKGWMECEECGELGRFAPRIMETIQLPVFHKINPDRLKAFLNHHRPLRSEN